MPRSTFETELSGLRRNFDSGATRTYEWRRRQLKQLDRLLQENSTALNTALKQDLGKCAVEARLTETAFLRAEIAHALGHLKKWMRPKKRDMPLSLQPARAKLQAEPLGVVLIIAPWNYPVQLLLSPLASALAAGNTAILKPSEVAPRCSAIIAELVPKYFKSDEVFVVEGGVAETTALLSLQFDHIFYTGNGHVARVVMEAAAQHLTPVTLELGGKCPAWVDQSADLQSTARRLVWAKFLNAGQTCVAPDHILATRSTLEALKPHLIAAIKSQFGEDILQSPDYGRIINERHFDRLIGLLANAQVVSGGQHDVRQRFIAPTLVEGIGDSHPLMQEEIFGPILPLIEVVDLDAALKSIRSHGKPLAVYAFTRDSNVKDVLFQHTASGALVFNMAVGHLGAPDVPFGGVGSSGMGSSHGEAGFRTFSHMRSIVYKPFWPDTLRLIMPPYGRVVERVIQYLVAKE